MPVPSTLASLSTTPGSNSPGGGENPFPELDDHIRQGYAFTAQLRDQKLNSSAVSAYMLTVLDDANAGAARTTLGAVGNTGNETIAGVKTFSSAPVSSAAAVAANELMRKGEVDSAVSAVSSGLAGKANLAGSASQAFDVAPATTANQATNYGQVFGLGQSWQNVTGSRAFNVDYTNSTGKPIVVAFYFPSSGSGTVSLVIDGVNLGPIAFGKADGPVASGQIHIPAGSTYQLQRSGSLTLTNWIEYR